MVSSTLESASFSCCDKSSYFTPFDILSQIFLQVSRLSLNSFSPATLKSNSLVEVGFNSFICEIPIWDMSTSPIIKICFMIVLSFFLNGWQLIYNPTIRLHNDQSFVGFVYLLVMLFLSKLTNF